MKKALIITFSIIAVIAIAGGVVLGVLLNTPKYNVNFVSDGVSVVTSQTVKEGGLVTKPADPTKEDYDFVGWYLGETKWNFATDKVTKDITLVAKWKEIETNPGGETGGEETPDPTDPVVEEFTVNFESNGGSSVKEETIQDGSLLTKPTNPTKVGYEFVGWYKEDTLNTKWDFDNDTITENTTLYAKWEAIEYRIVYNLWGIEGEVAGETIDNSSNPTTYTIEDTIIFNKPVREGYEFDGWYIYEISYGEKITQISNRTETLVLTAKWTKLHNVTFKNGDEVIDSYFVRDKSRVTEPKIDNLADGAVVARWEKEDGTVWSFSNTVNEDLVLIAIISQSTEIFKFALLGDGTYEVSSVSAETTPENLIIPSSFNGKPVTSVGRMSWFAQETCTTVTIPSSIEKIVDYAFDYCPSLQTVIFEENSNLKTIGERAFSWCKALQEIVIPNSVTTIVKGAFTGCDAMKKIQLPANLISLETDINGTNCYPINLETITFGGENERYYAVNNCVIEKETNTLVLGCKGSIIPNDGSVETIGRNAFYESNIENIQIPASIISIQSYAFMDCDNLVEVTFEKNSNLKEIQYCAFAYCDKLQSIHLPEGLEELGSEDEYGDEGEVFTSCKALTDISIPDSIKRIYRMCFNESAYYLDEANWEDGALYIGNSLIMLGQKQGVFEIKEGTIITADSAKWNANVSESTALILPNSLRIIGEDSIGYLPNITELVLPENLEYIGYHAFYNCGATTIDTSKCTKLKYVGDYAFSGCVNLTSFILPSSVEHLGEYSFYNCEQMLNFTFEKDCKVAKILERTFYNCTKLETIELSANIKSIEGEMAFGNLTALQELILPESLEYIGGYQAFFRCGATTIDTSKCTKLTHIGEYAFQYCSNLKSFNVPKSVESFDYGAFLSCESLTDFVIEEGSKLKEIGSILGNCSSLINVEIPYGIEKLDAPFSNCTSLRMVFLPESVTYLSDTIGMYNVTKVFCAGTIQAGNYNSETAVYFGVTEEDLILVDDIYYIVTNEPTKEVEVVTCATQKENIKVPSTIDIGTETYSVTKIGKYAFAFDRAAAITKNVVVPESVTKVEGKAFRSASENIVIFFEGNEIPSTWSTGWNGDAYLKIPCYLQNEWTYVNDIPTPIVAE